jgi:hypothetical protein
MKHFIKCSTKRFGLPVLPAVFIMIMALSYGCASQDIVSEKPFINFNADKVLVLKFKNMAQICGENETVQNPATGKYYITGVVSDSSELFLTEELVSRLKEHQGFSVITEDQANVELRDILDANKNSLKEKELLVEVGRSVGADAVVAGYIYKFKEREGARFSVSSPASIVFDISLLSTKDGSVVWSQSYNETERSLSEDLSQFKKFIKRKGWSTAGEMAASGLENMLKTFPSL